MKKTEENQEGSKFMQLWHNKRTHAAMVLGMWMIFFLFVIIISYVGGEATKKGNANNATPDQNEEIKKVEFKDYALMQTELLKNNFKYEYDITIGEYKVIYKGEKIGALETGYKETKDETIKYYIDETGLYKISMDELYANDKLYENLNESYINLEYIFGLLKDKSFLSEEIEETRSYTYKFVLENINYEIKIITNLNNIEEININYEDKVYLLKYNSINELENLSYIAKEVN